MPTYAPSITAAKFTVFDPKFVAPYVLDVGPYITGGSYSFDASGCASAQISTNLTYTRVEALGFFQGRNVIEISMADDQLQVACASGATKLYVGAIAAYVSPIGETMQIAIDDGSVATYRIPVTGTGTDGTGPYITIGSPLAGGGNFTTLPAYGAGAMIFIRRYTGRIAGRTRVNTRTTKATFQCVGMSKRLAEANGDFAYNAYDAGLAIYQAIQNYASQLTDLALASMPQVTIGTTYTGTSSKSMIADAVNNILTAIPVDIWTLWVGHDRVPRLIRVFNGTTQVYPYSVLLLQQNVSFVPMDVTQNDQDTSQMANRFLVVGDTDPTTQNPVQAQVSDTTSIATYGAIDSAPTAVTGVKDTTTAANVGQSLLNQRSYPRSSGSFNLFVKNSQAKAARAGFSSSTGLANGDQVFGYQAITVTGFNESEGPNMVPDSSIAFGTGAIALWNNVVNLGAATGPNVSVGAAPDGANAWKYSYTSGAASVGGYGYSDLMLVVPGQTYTISGYVDQSHLTGSGTNPAAQWGVVPVSAAGVVGAALTTTTAVAIGAAAVRVSAIFTVPAGTAFVKAFFQAQSTPASGTLAGYLLLYWPMISRGGVTTANLPTFTHNVASEMLYGLPSSVTSTFDAAGDRKQQVTFAPVVPDINAAIAERANAVAAQLLANTAVPANLEQYIVSAVAKYGFSYSSTSLSISMPAYLAQFAQGTAVAQISAATLTLTASKANYVWVSPSGAYTIKQNDSSPIAGSILLFYATCSSSGVVGLFFRAAVGVLNVGIANVNASLPAPTFSTTPTVANGQSINGVAADVNVSVPLNNVPQNGSAYGLQFYYRVAVASGGDGVWIPFEGVNLSGLPTPSASQTVTFSYGNLGSGTSYDFACGYLGIAGYGILATITTSFAARAIGIPGSYFTQAATAATPMIASGATIVVRAGLTGSTCTFRCTFSITNQPTDGSLAQILFFTYRASDSIAVYIPIFAYPAIGAGTASPPATGSYVVDVPNIPNGLTVGIAIAVSFISTGGASGPAVAIGSAYAQQIALPAPYLLGGTSLTPNTSGVTITPATSVSGLTASVTMAFTCTNQPTDGSLSQIVVYAKASTDAQYQPVASVPAAGLGSMSPAASGSYSGIGIANLHNGVGYIFAIAYENVQGGQTVLGLLGNITARSIGIGAPYMLGGGASLTPTISSSPLLNNALSANGISAAVVIALTLTNQPTDGSLSRVQFWYRLSSLNNGTTGVYVTPGNSSFRWSPSGSIAAVGVGSASPSASANYSTTIDVSPEQPYDFGVSYEDTQGNESLVGVIATSYTAQVVTLYGVGASRSMSGAITANTSSGSQNVGTASIAVPPNGTWVIQIVVTAAATSMTAASRFNSTVTTGAVTLTNVGGGTTLSPGTVTSTINYTAAGNQTVSINLISSNNTAAGAFNIIATRIS